MKSKDPCKKIAGKSSPKVDMGMSSATDWMGGKEGVRKAREGKGMKNRTGMGVYGEQGRREAGGHHEGEMTTTFAGGERVVRQAVPTTMGHKFDSKEEKIRVGKEGVEGSP
jgi:hypothetical protein